MNRIVDLLDENNHDGAVTRNEDGVYAFDGSAALKMTTFVGVSSTFSIIITARQMPQPGYFFSKNSASGSRYYALFSDPQLGTLTWFYRVAGAGSEAGERSVTIPLGLATGEYHDLLISVNETTLSITLNNGVPMERTLDGEVDDCESPGDDCVFYLGQRTVFGNPVARFQGFLSLAVLFADMVLDEFPMEPTTTSTTTTSTSTTSTATSTTTSTIATTTTMAATAMSTSEAATTTPVGPATTSQDPIRDALEMPLEMLLYKTHRFAIPLRSLQPP
jgi:hypothetical protein